MKLLLPLLLLHIFTHQNVDGFCIPEPDLCTRCDDKAVCETSKPSSVVPKNLPKELKFLEITYKGDESISLKAAMFHPYRQLVNISISGPKIYSLEEDVFSDLPLLEHVAVFETSVDQIPNRIFPSNGTNSLMKSLKLYKNGLVRIPYHLFDSLPMLTWLDLNWNPIVLEECSSIGAEFSKFSNLSVLKLANMSVNDSCKQLVGAHFFQPVQQTVKLLNLTISNVYHGDHTIFKDFKHLETLDISVADNLTDCPSDGITLFNNLPESLVRLQFRRWRSQDTMESRCIVDASTFAPLKQLPNLQILDMKYSNDILGKTLTKSVFGGFENITELNIAWCRFSSIEKSAFDGCPKLKKLSLDGNPLSNRPISLFSSANVSRLEYLKLTRAQIYSDYTENYQASLLLLNAPLKVISLKRNLLAKVPVFTYKDIRFDTLKKIELAYNYLTNLENSEISFGDQCEHLPNLTNVSFARNLLVNISTLSRCSNITFLDLSHNQLNKHWGEVNQGEIAQLTKIEVLDLSFNELNKISNTVFSKMAQLKKLYLIGNNISSIDSSHFEHNLFLRVLDFSGNSLREFKASYVQHLHHLKEIFLNDNSITVIDKRLITEYFNEYKIVTFSIIGNPLSCTCKQDFVKNWIKQTKIVPYSNELTCHGPFKHLRGQKVHNYDRDTFYCDYREGVIVALSILGGILGALLLGLPCYKYRWYLRHIRIVLRAVFFQVSQIQINQTCLYDAYVMYNAASVEDQRWVVSDLRKALELENAQNKTKLYIHDRDALPGSEVFTEMISSMEKSRKIIIILTNSYLKSSQCQGQADLAGRESYGRKVYQPNRIMVVVRERLDEEAIEAPFTSLLTENVVDMYNCSEGEVTRVWNRIRKFLKKPRYEFVKPNKYEPADDVEMQ